MHHKVEIGLDGRTITLETGKLAKQAHGAVLVGCGDSRVLVTACSNADPKIGASFFPLTCDYREFTYSAGKYPGGFIKREGRPSEKEVITSRLLDRPIRPLFPEGFSCETQIIAMVISADPDIDTAPLAIVGAAAALAISDIPFHHLLAGLRVGLIGGQLKANPTFDETRESEFSILVAGTRTGIVMVEAGGKGISEQDVLRCIEFAHQSCCTIIDGIEKLQKLAGKPKRTYTPAPINQELSSQIEKLVRADLTDALDTKKYSKSESYAKVDEQKKRAKESVPEEQQAEAGALFSALKEQIFRDEMLKKRHRPDGRAFDEVRHIEGEVGLLPRTHGSSIFTRGETQALVTVTLGNKDDEQRIELLDPAGPASKKFTLHYNFPPFSVGEVAFMRSPGRREIGHGLLAERAIAAVLPDQKDFPYTIRIVSDILESNGSSSMASVCGGILSLMDAGVPIAAPVAGIAMGLVKEGDDYAILTDIAGAEDHYGDMDFKVAGTKTGVTALQMDIKVPNVSMSVLKEALEQARKARLHILGKMAEVLAEPRKEMSPHAPRIFTLKIPVDKIRELIGPGGKMIRSIVEETGVKIDVEDDGTVSIFSADGKSAELAIQRVTDICAVAEIGKIYLGKVVRIVDFGAFVEIFPGTDGLLHISEIAENRIKNVQDELKEGDQIQVKCIGMEGNKIKLSRRAVLKELREKMKVGASN